MWLWKEGRRAKPSRLQKGKEVWTQRGREGRKEGDFYLPFSPHFFLLPSFISRSHSLQTNKRGATLRARFTLTVLMP